MQTTHDVPRRSRVLLVDDHPAIRAGLANAIAQTTDLVVSAEAGDIPSALAAAEAQPPDVAVVDLQLGEADGLDLVKALRAKSPSLPMLVFSMHNESLHAERALRAGARGYLNKQVSMESVVAGLRQLLAGAIHVSPAMSSRLLSKMVHGPGRDDPEQAVARLSQREYEVFRLIGQGIGPKAAAGKLGVSVKTIETYREQIKSKLNLPDARQLLRRAMQHVESDS